MVKPTVMAAAADAGDSPHASIAGVTVPADTTTTTPASCAACTARFCALEKRPEIDKEMIDLTLGFWRASATAHSMPAITPVSTPEASHDSTCHGIATATKASAHAHRPKRSPVSMRAVARARTVRHRAAAAQTPQLEPRRSAADA